MRPGTKGNWGTIPRLFHRPIRFSSHRKNQCSGIFTAGGRIMTDIGRHAHVTPPRTQTPVQSYFDDDLFQLERQLTLQKSAVYVAHVQMVPDPGDWRSLSQERAARPPRRADQGG